MKKQTLILVVFLLVSTIINAQWTQIGSDIDGEAKNDWSGRSVSISSDGSVVAIGAWWNDGNGTDAGHVRIYKNIDGIWTQIGSDIDGEAAGDGFGGSVSLSADGSVVAIGASFAFGNDHWLAGHVRVYENISGSWTQIGRDIDGEAENDFSGWSVSISSDGSVVAIGAFANDDNGTHAGHVRIYKNVFGIWTQIGRDIDGEASGDGSGSSVSISSDGSVVAIGAIGNDENGIDAGHVRIYENISGIWTQIGRDIDGKAAEDEFGKSVSLNSDGSIVAILANGNDSAGSVRIYKDVSGTWTQIGQDIDGEAAGDGFGGSVSLSSDGSIVAIGANGNDGNGIKAGHVRIYKNIDGVWTQIGSDIDGEAKFDISGFSVSLSSEGSVVAIGAPCNDGRGSIKLFTWLANLFTIDCDAGHVRIYTNPTISVNK
jgi:Flp pilus assembly pilin Flp